jgi:hypothetical protein
MCPAEAHGAGLHCAPAPLDAPPDEAVEGCLFAHTLRTTRGPGFGFGGPSDILLAPRSHTARAERKQRTLRRFFVPEEQEKKRKKKKNKNFTFRCRGRANNKAFAS